MFAVCQFLVFWEGDRLQGYPTFTPLSRVRSYFSPKRAGSQAYTRSIVTSLLTRRGGGEGWGGVRMFQIWISPNPPPLRVLSTKLCPCRSRLSPFSPSYVAGCLRPCRLMEFYFNRTNRTSVKTQRTVFILFRVIFVKRKKKATCCKLHYIQLTSYSAV